MLERRTKIVATLGPATDADGVLDRLVAAGLDCARLNCSHGTHEDLRRRAAEVRAAASARRAAARAAVRPAGPEAAPGRRDRAARSSQVGDEVTFGPGGVLGRLRQVHRAGHRALGDRDRRRRAALRGRARGRPERRHACVSPGPLAPRKGINVTYARPELPAITEKDVADLGLAAELGADFIALSFVRSAADIEQLRKLALELGSAAKLIAKIEKIEAYEALDEIIEVSDGLMVARGDYGVEAGVARVPLMQKDTIRRATQQGKFVITATQMLESMIQASEPTRAEATDVANAVIDGTSAVMLSAETSVGTYPVEAVRAMAEIAQAAEEYPVIHGRRGRCTPGSTGEEIMRAAVELAEALDAAALIVPSSTGGAARACAKYRKRRPIIALAHQPGVADQLTLEWGVYPTDMPTAETVDEMIEVALVTARDFAGLETGARVVLTAGRRTGTPGATNLVMVREIP